MTLVGKELMLSVNTTEVSFCYGIEIMNLG